MAATSRGHKERPVTAKPALACADCARLGREVAALRERLFSDRSAFAQVNDELAKSNARFQRLLSELETRMVGSLQEREASLQRITSLERELARTLGRCDALQAENSSLRKQQQQHVPSGSPAKSNPRRKPRRRSNSVGH